MTTHRKAAAAVALGIAPLALTGLTATPAAAHGSMTDPVSRVAACHAEGPESPQSEACKAAVAASGSQAFYDWNEVNIADAAGRHREIIPDGELCSAGREKYQGLDLAREDWPASELSSGQHTFRYKATAPHTGSFELYVTKDGYDPNEPLTWAALEDEPFAEVTDPKLENGDYLIDGEVPQRSGRHLVYSIWQRSDSPEAFYTCSDVDFSGSGGATATDEDAPSAPTDEQLAKNRDKSTVSRDGHGADHTNHDGHDKQEEAGTSAAGEATAGNDAAPMGGAKETNLAETGGDSSTSTIAMGGAVALLAGTGLLVTTMRRRALGRHRG